MAPPDNVINWNWDPEGGDWFETSAKILEAQALDGPIFWDGTYCVWKTAASEILDEEGSYKWDWDPEGGNWSETSAKILEAQALEGPIFWEDTRCVWKFAASEILNEKVMETGA